MITVYKCPLNFGTTFVTLPMSHRVLKAAPDPNGKPCVWVWLNASDAMGLSREFVVVGTGNPAPNPATHEHVDSFIDGPFIWHVFVTKR